jgi:hypothetical protein
MRLSVGGVGRPMLGVPAERSSGLPAALSPRASTASSDHLPGPFISRKIVVSNCAQSERTS